ncbi:MAG: DUF2156 domain-containing protein [Clostridia bacterium]|nr:DUF2156 domain-containing protein [Clostridia bacterium]
MYSFFQPDIKIKDQLKSVFDVSQPESCEYSVGNILGWCRHYGAEIAFIDDCLVSRNSRNGYFGFPKGNDVSAALMTIKHSFNEPNFYGLTEREVSYLESLCPGEYAYSPTRNFFDYVYRVEDLAGLKGKKYHSKRNHIAYFEKNSNWSYEEIDERNIEECIAMYEKWFELNVDRDREGLETEREVLEYCFRHYFELDFLGGLIRTDGEVVAFTCGEKLNDTTFDTHFEKAFSDIRGAFPMINREFAKNSLTEYEFVNREDDTGSEGLRKAKLSYHPILLEKFTAVKL